jgi:hypothetical protein
MPRPLISFSTRKALEVHLGEEAGREVANVLQKMAEAVANLEKKKVDVTPIAPANSVGLMPLARLLMGDE